ncbi:MAG: hypothetical protein QG664_98 [Patescibacteria group bacterium]|nr:hypothetical protein [Patescibacteria group bacterium]
MRYADLKEGDVFQLGVELDTTSPVFSFTIDGEVSIIVDGEVSITKFDRGVARRVLNTTLALDALAVGTFFSMAGTRTLYQKVGDRDYQPLNRPYLTWIDQDSEVVRVEIAGEYSWG